MRPVPFFVSLTVFAAFLAAPLWASARTPVTLVYDHVVRFQTAEGPVFICAHLAATPKARQIGLMWQTDLPPKGGMLFYLPRAEPMSMWMRNTLISLDMIFIDEKARIQRIAERTEPLSERLISSGGPVRFVLEIEADKAAQFGLAEGQEFRVAELGEQRCDPETGKVLPLPTPRN